MNVKQVSVCNNNASYEQNNRVIQTEWKKIRTNLQLWIAKEKNSLLYEKTHSNHKYVYVCVCIDWAFAFNLSRK